MKYLKGIIALLPLVITAAVLPLMPESVPMHYNAEGAVDRMGSRNELLLMPLMIILIVAVSAFVMKHYERRAEGPEDDREAISARTNLRTLKIISVTIPAIFGLLQLGVLYMTYRNANAQDVEVNSHMIVRLTAILMGIMCIVMGNLMPKTAINHIFGCRVSWSIYNENTWRKCNRFGGIVFIVIGLLLFVTSALVPTKAIALLMTGYLLAGTAVMLGYAYRVYKEEIAGQKK